MTVADKGTLGFASELSGEQAHLFLDALNRKVADGDTQALYASYAGQPAFFVMMNLSGMPNCRHSAELAKAVVAPGFRGQGLPKQALEAVDHTCTLFWNMYDNLHREYCQPSPVRLS
ncbi:hypothetical protein ACU6HM_12725 [Alcaligenes sp. RM2]